jgi:DNA polymerase-3 subunit beta
MPVEDYPRLPELPPVAGGVDATTFGTAVTQVATAFSREESLPILTGVRVAVEGEKMTLLSSDRYRAAQRELHWQPADPKLEAEFLVPGRALVDAAKAFAHAPGDLELALDQDVLSGGTLGFRSAGRQLTTRLLDGTYPPIERLFGVEHPVDVTVPVATLTEVVKRVALFAERTSPIVVQLDNSGLTVEAHGARDAEASERIEAGYTGEPTTLAFNEAYLLDGLAVLHSADVTISFVAPLKPVALKPSGGGFAYLLQPVRVK